LCWGIFLWFVRLIWFYDSTASAGEGRRFVERRHAQKFTSSMAERRSARRRRECANPATRTISTLIFAIIHTMSLTSLLWLVAAILATIAFITWALRGRRYGYKALATRSLELTSKGSEVYLLYSTGSVGVWTNMPMNITSWWDFINTGYLAYIEGGRLHIEFPWWNRMQPLGDSAPNNLTIEEGDFIYAQSKKPGVRIGSKIYAVAGINVNDVASVKQALDLKDTSILEANRKIFENTLARIGLNVGPSN